MRFGVLIIILYVLLALAIDFGLWFTEVRSRGKRVKRTFQLSCLLCYILLGVGVALPWRTIGVAITPKMLCLYTWMSIYIVKICVVLWSLVGCFPLLWKGKRRRLGLYIGLPLGLIFFGLMWWGVLGGRYIIDVRHVQIISQRLPEKYNGYRIVQISDLHLGTWGTDTSFLTSFVDSINACHPDLILFTGDIVNRDANELKPFLPVLRRLHAPDGIITVMGNHDYGSYGDWPSPQAEAANERMVRTLQTDIGWKMLQNSHLALHRGNDSIIIIGVENWGEPPFPSYGDLTRALATAVDSGSALLPDGPEFKILLSHNPEHWRQHVRKESNIDLTLSGHTHGMQTELRFCSRRWSPAAWRYPAWGGLYYSPSHKNAGLLYVNIGAGEVGLPFRIGASPEITVFTLTRNNDIPSVAHPLD